MGKLTLGLLLTQPESRLLLSSHDAAWILSGADPALATRLGSQIDGQVNQPVTFRLPIESVIQFL